MIICIRKNGIMPQIDVLSLFALLMVSKSTLSSPIENEAQSLLEAKVDGLESKLDQIIIHLEEEKILRGNLQSKNTELEKKIHQIASENARQVEIFKAQIDLLTSQNIQQQQEIRQLNNKISDGVANIIQPKSADEVNNRMPNIYDETNILISLDDSSPRLPPSSCRQLSTIGHYLDGIYLVANPETNKIETVYCDFGSSTLSETLFGNVDVKSQSVHFYVQKNKDFVPSNSIIPFDVERLNVGGAMNLATGVFTVPVDGIYHFEFSALKNEDITEVPYLYLQLRVNGAPIGSSYAPFIEGNWVGLSSISSSLRLKTGDQVSLVKGAGFLQDDGNHYTHFTGWLVEEDLQIFV